jgi:hypothetical protein
LPTGYSAGRKLRTQLVNPSGTRRLQWASAIQRDAFQYGPAPICLSGGFGAGKTLCATRKILYINDLFPGNRGVIARRVGDELRKTTMPTFFKDCPPEAYMEGGRRADQEKILRLNPRMCDDGVLRSSEILFLHLDDPEIQHILRGLEINWFLLDQAEEMEEEMFDVLMKRIGRWDQAFVPSWLMNQEHAYGRPWAWWNTPDGKYREGALAIPPTYPMITVNPDLETHWVWRRFHPDSEEYQQKWHALGYRMFTFNPLDNRFLPLQNRQELLAADPEWQERFVYGKWGAGKGTIHKIPPEAIVEGNEEVEKWIVNNCTLHRVLDHGDTSPTACLWFGVDDSGNCYCYREYYMPDKLIGYHRDQIIALSGDEKYTFNIADPSIFYKVMQKREGRYSVADEYSDSSGLHSSASLFWTPGSNDEMGTRNRINEYLRVDPDRIHPFTKQKGSPRLFFIKRNEEYPNGCRNTLRELSSQRKKKTGSENGKDTFSDERDKDVPDHTYDCVRYFTASRPPLHTTQKKKKLAGTMIEARMMLKRQLRANPEWRRRQYQRLRGF